MTTTRCFYLNGIGQLVGTDSSSKDAFNERIHNMSECKPQTLYKLIKSKVLNGYYNISYVIGCGRSSI